MSGETPGRFAHLPEPVRLEETFEVVSTDDAPDPDFGRDPETEFLLRHAAG